MNETTLRCVSSPAATSSKQGLRTLTEQIPADKRIPMLLGLDGDCDFTRQLTPFFPYQCGKEDLLALFDQESLEELPPVRGLPGFRVLCRRHAVWVPALLNKKEDT